MADQTQSGIGGLHHHVQQHHRNILAPGQHATGLRRRQGADDLERAALEAEVTQQHPGHGMDIGIVVDHQDRPGLGRGGIGGRIASQRQLGGTRANGTRGGGFGAVAHRQIIVLGHIFGQPLIEPDCDECIGGDQGARGMTTVKTVPPLSGDSATTVPPRGPVTRL